MSVTISHLHPKSSNLTHCFRIFHYTVVIKLTSLSLKKILYDQECLQQKSVSMVCAISCPLFTKNKKKIKQVFILLESWMWIMIWFRSVIVTCINKVTGKWIKFSFVCCIFLWKCFEWLFCKIWWACFARYYGYA